LQVRFVDLTLPQYWLPRYDWVLSLNVIEHIPQQFESVVLDNMVRVAGEGIVLSWATPAQDGFQHVNLREPTDVERLMGDRNLYRDQSAIDKLQQVGWFKVSLGVYRRHSVLNTASDRSASDPV
jgi:hypothetical protein